MSEVTDLPNLKSGKTIQIHQFADVSPLAEIEEGVVIGSGTFIGPNVHIGAHTSIGSNVVIEGKVDIGSGNKIFPGACIGLEPQDLKYKGAETQVLIGNRNTIREYVTINRATYEGEKTIIGDDNLLMAYCHLGHNCELKNGVVMSNSVQVAGHVIVEDRAVIGGCLGIHQFVHIGYLAMVGGMTRVDRDIPPFCLAEGHPGRLRGLNRVGIRRSGLDADNPEEFRELQEIWNLLFKSDCVISKGLLLARSKKLMSSADKLCSFLEASIQKNRRGPMPLFNNK